MSEVFLKIKIKSLVAEAKIIRFEEARHSGELRSEMKDHRKMVVGEEARASLVAYAFIRGRTYEQTEPKARWKNKVPSKKGPDWIRVAHMVTKYGRKSKPTGDIVFKNFKQYSEEVGDRIKIWANA